VTSIRYPSITGQTEAEQLVQLKSYLYQLVAQLNYALQNTEQMQVYEKISPAKSDREEDPVNDFASIKGLIIKSADIVNAYYEEIDNLLKLSGEYTASSDFGDFKEATENRLDADTQSITQILSSVQEINNFTVSTSAHIRSGILDYNGTVPVYGLEVGQTVTENGEEVFNKFARFTAEKLSFYDSAGNELAYISGYKLYITNVYVTSSFQAGGYKDYIGADGSKVTKWVGGN
jgi:hypothetical protein